MTFIIGVKSYMRVNVTLDTYIHTYIHTHVHTHIHVPTHTYMYSHKHTNILCYRMRSHRVTCSHQRLYPYPSCARLHICHHFSNFPNEPEKFALFIHVSVPSPTFTWVPIPYINWYSLNMTSTQPHYYMGAHPLHQRVPRPTFKHDEYPAPLLHGCPSLTSSGTQAHL